MKSKLLYHDLYYMAYSHTLDAWSRGQLPTRRIAVGTQVLRSVSLRYGVYLVRASDARSASRLESENRWTGPRPPKEDRPDTSGLYLSMHYHALRGELLHYGLHDLSAAMRGRHQHTQKTRGGGRQHPVLGSIHHLDERAVAATKRVFLFRTIEPIEVVDLSLASGTGRAFIRELGQKDEIRKALEKAGYATAEDAYAASGDHSFDRAIGNAVHDGQLHKGYLGGLIASTVRDAEVPQLDMGDNLILFGSAQEPERRLRAVQEFVFYRDSATTYLYDHQERIIDQMCLSGP